MPRPDSPQMNSGLYARAGASATATAEACAKRFEAPITKVSKVYFGLRLAPEGVGAAVGRSAKYDGQLAEPLRVAVSCPAPPTPCEVNAGFGCWPTNESPPNWLTPNPATSTEGAAAVDVEVATCVVCSTGASVVGGGVAIRTPRSTGCPRWRDRALRMVSRSVRSICSWTSGVGTVRRANPSARVNGWTSDSHAFCCRVRGSWSPPAESLLSSATTCCQTSPNESRSEVTVRPSHPEKITTDQIPGTHDAGTGTDLSTHLSTDVYNLGKRGDAVHASW